MAGLNTDIERNKVNYHLQTEDKGKGINYVETVVFKSGKVLFSRKSSYASYLNQPDLKQKIQELIKKQHEECLQDVSAGKFDHL
jgi:hypothetical protein